MTKDQISAILADIHSWPIEDQEELAELARDIVARRSGVYHASAEELAAIDEAERSGIATEVEVAEAFESFLRK